MSENREGGWVIPFFLGFLLGVLLTLGAGGSLVFTLGLRARQDAMRAEAEARMRAVEAERSMEEAMAARRAAEEAAAREEERRAAVDRAEEAEKKAVAEAGVRARLKEAEAAREAEKKGKE